MKKYYRKKIIWYLVTLVIAVLLNFLLPRLMPGDPVATMVSQAAEGVTSKTAVQQIYNDYAEKFGTNKPLVVQFFIYVKNLFHGDLGVSFSQYPRTVSNVISSAVWWTICLQLPAIVVGWIIGNVLGAVAAYRKSGWDKIVLPLFLFFSNIPAFGMAVILLFIIDK